VARGVRPFPTSRTDDGCAEGRTAGRKKAASGERREEETDAVEVLRQKNNDLHFHSPSSTSDLSSSPSSNDLKPIIIITIK